MNDPQSISIAEQQFRDAMEVIYVLNETLNSLKRDIEALEIENKQLKRDLKRVVDRLNAVLGNI